MATNDEKPLMSMAENTPPTGINSSSSKMAVSKPMIIGIYGLLGSGKTTMLNLLRNALAEDHHRFRFIEGSEMVVKSLPLGVVLETLKFQSEEVKLRLRTNAINEIVRMCREDERPAIVTGHFIFWDGKGEVSKPVMNDADKQAFTHIIYLHNDPEEIARRRDEDSRNRGVMGVDKLREWQDAEMSELQELCRENEIPFTTVRDHSTATKFINSFVRYNSMNNEEDVARELKKSVEFQAFLHNSMGNEEFVEGNPESIAKVSSMMESKSKIKTMLVIDADKTLAPEDASELFWKELQKLQKNRKSHVAENPLKWNFSGARKYSYMSFRQAGLLYYGVDHTEFKEACSKVVEAIKIRPEFKQLLSLIADSESVGVVVATCGIKSIWQQVLERDVPNKNITVIGGNESIDGYVVTPETKANLVTMLRDDHNIHVCAIGDSHVDVEMLTRADMSFVVVGPEDGRSISVEPELLKAFKENGLRARQILFPPESAPRLTDKELSTATFYAKAFVEELERPHSLDFAQATNKSAVSLLAADSRNVDIHGLDLHRAHRKIGWYLATEYVSEKVGVEAYDMTSVQDKPIKGHRLLDESKTCIVPLMRGGEPMARGVWEAFPSAMFLHAKGATDVQAKHLEGKWTVILVDAVINSGKSIVEFVRHVRENLSRQIRIVIVAGVVQEKAVAALQKDLVGIGDVSLVALRTSERSFAGVGPTDTGHRLFNSTHLD
jgi:uracil phosphoribosyltransferase/adenylate kinase/2-hydroxy-3-keto-5-methylthiopentenyl-1-phosphate phosphatase